MGRVANVRVLRPEAKPHGEVRWERFISEAGHLAPDDREGVREFEWRLTRFAKEKMFAVALMAVGSSLYRRGYENVNLLVVPMYPEGRMRLLDLTREFVEKQRETARDPASGKALEEIVGDYGVSWRLKMGPREIVLFATRPESTLLFGQKLDVERTRPRQEPYAFIVLHA